ncbi:MAG: hypothetical protein ACYC3I_06940 [Gemmataceae bacterium]
MPPSEFLTDPEHDAPHPATDSIPSIPSSLASANGDEETALARLADDGGPPAPPNEAAAPVVPSLEQRVRRLEEFVTLLQERRAAETPTAAVPAVPAATQRPPETRPLPLATPAASTGVLLEVGKRLMGVASPVSAAVPASLAGVGHTTHRWSGLWLVWDTWAEARAIVRMFVDPRYHQPWSARLWPLILLAAILTSKFWVPGSSIPILGDWLLVKLVDLMLAYLLFKWLGHEARRYRQTSPDLPANLRL